MKLQILKCSKNCASDSQIAAFIRNLRVVQMVSYPHLDFDNRRNQIPILKKFETLNELELDLNGYEFNHLKLRYNRIELFDHPVMKLDLFGHTLISSFYDIAKTYG